MAQVVAEMRIQNKGDMDCIEQAIVRQLGGEGSRCVFLRSCAYIRLRMAALYKNYSGPHSVFHGGICVRMTPGQPPLVRVLQLDRVTEDLSVAGQKRPRADSE